MQGGIEIPGIHPIVIPVFVSHLGCPQRCVFCDQTQFSAPMQPRHVAAHVDKFISHCRMAHDRRRILGFFGGSFTGIGHEMLHGYLDVVRSLMAEGVIHAAKASTRPDMVSEDTLGSLREAGFEELEIGVQSMDDLVLAASSRGHTKNDVALACTLVKKSGMRLGIQLMPGLPNEDRGSFIKTLDRVLQLQPDTARIYPAVVLAGTRLEELYLKGDYQPLSLDEALRRSLYAFIRLEGGGCRVLRTGLPPSSGLRVVSGPYHPSFGFLVRAYAYKIMARRVMDRLGGGCKLAINPRSISELVGYRRSTIEELNFSYSFDDTLPSGYIRAHGLRESACIQLQDILEYIL